MTDLEYLEWVMKNWETQEFYETMTIESPRTVEEFKEIIDELVEDQLE